jgi:hypothetical protein
MEPDLSAALARVVDEADPNPDLVRWAIDELVAGRTLEAVTAALTEQGWPINEAEPAVEEARVRTRRDRGVITRADVVGDLNARHHGSMTGMATFYRSSVSLLGIFGFLSGLRSAIGSVRRLHRVARGGAGDREPT